MKFNTDFFKIDTDFIVEEIPDKTRNRIWLGIGLFLVFYAFFAYRAITTTIDGERLWFYIVCPLIGFYITALMASGACYVYKFASKGKNDSRYWTVMIFMFFMRNKTITFPVWFLILNIIGYFLLAIIYDLTGWYIDITDYIHIFDIYDFDANKVFPTVGNYWIYSDNYRFANTLYVWDYYLVSYVINPLWIICMGCMSVHIYNSLKNLDYSQASEFFIEIASSFTNFRVFLVFCFLPIFIYFHFLGYIEGDLGIGEYTGYDSDKGSISNRIKTSSENVLAKGHYHIVKYVSYKLLFFLFFCMPLSFLYGFLNRRFYEKYRKGNQIIK